MGGGLTISVRRKQLLQGWPAHKCVQPLGAQGQHQAPAVTQGALQRSVLLAAWGVGRVVVVAPLGRNRSLAGGGC